jgi:hypothetical protein
MININTSSQKRQYTERDSKVGVLPRAYPQCGAKNLRDLSSAFRASVLVNISNIYFDHSSQKSSRNLCASFLPDIADRLKEAPQIFRLERGTLPEARTEVKTRNMGQSRRRPRGPRKTPRLLGYGVDKNRFLRLFVYKFKRTCCL